MTIRAHNRSKHHPRRENVLILRTTMHSRLIMQARRRTSMKNRNNSLAAASAAALAAGNTTFNPKAVIKLFLRFFAYDLRMRLALEPNKDELVRFLFLS